VTQRILETPRDIPLGFAMFILPMAVSLSNRVTRLFGKLERHAIELSRLDRRSQLHRRPLFAPPTKTPFPARARRPHSAARDWLPQIFR
jgi:hypothetical protein